MRTVKKWNRVGQVTRLELEKAKKSKMLDLRFLSDCLQYMDIHLLMVQKDDDKIRE